MAFSANENTFVPGHKLQISLEDPIDEKNYYYWKYRSFEKLIYCDICTGGDILRRGDCIDSGPGNAANAYFVYYCNTNCWRIRNSESIAILNDEFQNGARIVDFNIDNLLLYSKTDILVEMEQFSLNFEAYDYFNRVKELVDNNGNFDSAPPSAIIGNLVNKDDPEEIVLGRFTAATSSTRRLFIKRDGVIDEKPLEIRSVLPPIVETDPPFRPNITTADCPESRTITSKRPIGWQGN